MKEILVVSLIKHAKTRSKIVKMKNYLRILVDLKRERKAWKRKIKRNGERILKQST